MLGFPDGWVSGLVAAGVISRTQALKMLGNAVQVQCGTVAGAYLFDLFGVEVPVLAREEAAA